LFIIHTIPYGRKRLSEDVPKTYFLLPVFLATENSFKRGRERRIEINAGRNLPLCRDIKVPKRILLAHGYIDGRKGWPLEWNLQGPSICLSLFYDLFILILTTLPYKYSIFFLPDINAMADVGENHLFNSYLFGKSRNKGDFEDIVFDHEEDDVHFGPEQSLTFFLFMKKTNGLKNLLEMGVDPDGIMLFWSCP
jgi:hypothetical protein